MGGGGPACGWVLAYVEVLLGKYHLSLRAAVCELPLAAGFAILEARGCRLNPHQALGYIERAIWAARDACQAELERDYHITE